MTRQPTLMEKGIIPFKHNSRFVCCFLDSLLNCWQPTAVHKSDAMIRLINTSLQMCSGKEMKAYRIVIGMSLEIMPKQYVETFFSKTSCFWFLKYTQDF